MKTAFCLVLGLLLMMHSPPSSLAQSSASTSADVTLTIETWCQISLPPTLPPPDDYHIVMDTVKPYWFCHDWETKGHTFVSVETNTNVTLQCPKTTTLADGGPYTLNAAVDPVSVFPEYQNEDYWFIDFPPGSYPDQITLWVRLQKHWLVEDIAGTYYATVLLELIPNP